MKLARIIGVIASVAVLGSTFPAGAQQSTRDATSAQKTKTAEGSAQPLQTAQKPASTGDTTVTQDATRSAPSEEGKATQDGKARKVTPSSKTHTGDATSPAGSAKAGTVDGFVVKNNGATAYNNSENSDKSARDASGIAPADATSIQSGPASVGGLASLVTTTQTTSGEDDDVVVVGRRTEVGSFSSERSVSVVTSRTMQETMPRTTPEALWDSEGIFVQETNFGGGAPIIRGMVGPQILLVYDGVRLNNSVYRTGPNQYLTLVDPLYVSKMEVLRGAGSVLYGSDAMGGVIYMHGPQRPDVTGLRALGRAGSAALEKTAHGAVGIASDRAAAYFGGALHSYADLRGGRDTGVQIFSGYDVYSAAGKGWMNLPGGMLLTAGVLFTDIEGAGRTDKLWVKSRYQEYDNTETMIYARLSKEWERWKFSYTFSFQDFYEDKRSYTMDLDRMTATSMKSDETRVYTTGSDLSLRGQLSHSLSLVGGALWYHDLVHSNRYKSSDMMAWERSGVSDYPDGSTYDRFGAFGYLVWRGGRLLHGYFQSTAGWRVQGASAWSPAAGDLPETDFSFIGNTLHASVQHIIPGKTNVGLVFSQGFRAPNLQESVMLGDAGKYFHTPNDSLSPENMHSLEAFLRFRRGGFSAGVSGYVSYIDGILKRVHTEWDGQTEIDGKPVVHHVNGDHAILTGTEARMSWYLGKGVSVRANTTWTMGTEYADDGSSSPMSKIPPLFGMASLRKVLLGAGWTGYAETYVRWAAKQDRLSPADQEDPRIPNGGTPGWWTWNVRMGYRSGDLALSVVIENILDKTYKYHGSGVYAPGTNAIFQLTWMNF